MLRSWFSFLLCFLVLCSCTASKPARIGKHIPPAVLSKEPETLTEKRKIVVQHALKSIGAPYRWGGTTPANGLDCSGLVVYSHKAAGIQVPRTAKNQFNKGNRVTKFNLRPADLVFFTTSEKSKSIHVGLYVGDGMFIHSPGKGRQVSWANLDNPFFKSSFIGARTYL